MPPLRYFPIYGLGVNTQISDAKSFKNQPESIQVVHQIVGSKPQ